jgi:hypothetical protein
MRRAWRAIWCAVAWVVVRAFRIFAPAEFKAVIRTLELVASPAYDITKQAIKESTQIITEPGTVSWHWLQQSSHHYYPESPNVIRRMEACRTAQARIAMFMMPPPYREIALLVEIAYWAHKYEAGNR